MKITRPVRLGNFRRINVRQRVIGHHRPGNMIQQTRIGISGIGVFIDAPVFMSEVGGHQFLHVEHQLLVAAHFFMLRAVKDIGFGGFGKSPADERLFDRVLDLFDIGDAVFGILFDQCVEHILADLPGDLVIGGSGGLECLRGGQHDPVEVKIYDPSVTLAQFLDDFHSNRSSCMGKRREDSKAG